MTKPTPMPIPDRTCKRAQELIRRALLTVREARRAGPWLEPDTDIVGLYRNAEECLEGIIVNLKAWEKEEAG